MDVPEVSTSPAAGESLVNPFDFNRAHREGL
jgi:hypothetical protein